jgi:hypothetical protein
VFVTDTVFSEQQEMKSWPNFFSKWEPKAGWRKGKALGSEKGKVMESGTFAYIPKERQAFGLNFVFGRVPYDKSLIMRECFGRKISSLSLPKGQAETLVIFLFLLRHKFSFSQYSPLFFSSVSE